MSDAPSETAPASDESAADFALDAEVPVRRGGNPTIYKHPLAHYTHLGRGLRVLKGYVALGRAASPPDLPPFDEPHLLQAWWQKHKTNRCPDCFVKLARDHKASARAALPPASPGATSAAVPLASVQEGDANAFSMTPSEKGGRGFEAALQRRRDEEAETGALYASLTRQATAAADRGDVDEASRLTSAAEQVGRRLEKVAKLLQGYEKDAPNVLAAAERTWVANDVVTTLETVHTAMQESLRAFWTRLRPKLLAIPDPDEQDVLVTAELDRLFAGWGKTRFAAIPEHLLATADEESAA